MAVTVSGTSITFNDATVQTTAAGAPTTAQVLSATAGASVGAVGTYAFLAVNTGTGATSPGGTRAGSTLLYCAASASAAGVPSGTWRCMGRANGTYDDDFGVPNSSAQTLFLRIS